jgi:hypothetical protein
MVVHASFSPCVYGFRDLLFIDLNSLIGSGIRLTAADDSGSDTAFIDGELLRSTWRDYLRLMIAAAVDAFQARWVDAENRKSLL